MMILLFFLPAHKTIQFSEVMKLLGYFGIDGNMLENPLGTDQVRHVVAKNIPPEVADHKIVTIKGFFEPAAWKKVLHEGMPKIFISRERKRGGEKLACFV